MAKKKSKPASQTPALSDKNYLLSGRARKLPLYKCFVNSDWQETGIAQIFVLRKHANNNITAGIFLVDLYCAGVKDAFYMFNLPESEFEGRILNTPLTYDTIPYELAHNIIYGAVAFAEEYGILPPADFKIAHLILEEDTEDIPLIELEFGKDGMPLLVINEFNPRNDYYLRQLEKNAGPGNYHVVRNDFLSNAWDDDDFDDEFDDEDLPDFEAWTRTDWEDFLSQPDLKQSPDYLIALQYIFEQAYPIPDKWEPIVQELLHPRDFEITYDALPIPNYDSSDQELNEYDEIVPALKKPEVTQHDLEKIESRLKSNIAKWPENPIFYNFLANTYLFLKANDKADEITKSIFQKFPDYFTGKVQYANYLIRTGQEDQIPALFNNKYDVPAIFPDRDLFHFSELANFYSMMSAYFLKKEELFMANLYGHLLKMVSPQTDSHIHSELWLKQIAKSIQEAEEMVETALKSPESTRQLIDLIIKPYRLAPLFEED